MNRIPYVLARTGLRPHDRLLFYTTRIASQSSHTENRFPHHNSLLSPKFAPSTALQLGIINPPCPRLALILQKSPPSHPSPQSTLPSQPSPPLRPHRCTLPQHPVEIKQQKKKGLSPQEQMRVINHPYQQSRKSASRRPMHAFPPPQSISARSKPASKRKCELCQSQVRVCQSNSPVTSASDHLFHYIITQQQPLVFSSSSSFCPLWDFCPVVVRVTFCGPSP